MAKAPLVFLVWVDRWRSKQRRLRLSILLKSSLISRLSLISRPSLPPADHQLLQPTRANLPPPLPTQRLLTLIRSGQTDLTGWKPCFWLRLWTLHGTLYSVQWKLRHPMLHQLMWSGPTHLLNQPLNPPTMLWIHWPPTLLITSWVPRPHFLLNQTLLRRSLFTDSYLLLLMSPARNPSLLVILTPYHQTDPPWTSYRKKVNCRRSGS